MVGCRPTVQPNSQQTDGGTHLLDWSGDYTGGRVHLVQFLKPQAEFDSLELKAQIDQRLRCSLRRTGRPSTRPLELPIWLWSPHWLLRRYRLSLSEGAT